MNEQQQHQLKILLSEQLNIPAVSEIKCKIMSGGAIQENWSIEPVNSSDDWALVLRKNSNTVLQSSSDRAQEYLLLKRLFEYGVTVPEPLYFSKKDNFLDSDFFIMKKVYGVTEGHKLVKLNNPNQQANVLQGIGTQIAKIHQIKNDSALEQLLDKPAPHEYLSNLLNDYLKQIDALNRKQPVLEYALKWMSLNLPEVKELVLVHGDFRTGNIMVDGDQVTGILDWEFTHWGDAREDIGWFTAKCWRFGQDQNIAGGIGDYQDFMSAYEKVSGTYIKESELKFWHLLAHIKWAVIAMQQAHRNIGAQSPSLELALTDFFLPMLEKNILDLLEYQS